jgi:hypothetical protein
MHQPSQQKLPFSEIKRDYISYMRGINPAFPEPLEGVAPHDVVANTTYLYFQKRVFGYLCVVMKHPIAAIALQDFQRDPSFSTECRQAQTPKAHSLPISTNAVLVELLAYSQNFLTREVKEIL